jgi:hypothetical protein
VSGRTATKSSRMDSGSPPGTSRRGRLAARSSWTDGNARALYHAALRGSPAAPLGRLARGSRFGQEIGGRGDRAAELAGSGAEVGIRTSMPLTGCSIVPMSVRSFRPGRRWCSNLPDETLFLGRNDASLSRLCHGQTASCQPASSLSSAREGVPLAERSPAQPSVPRASPRGRPARDPLTGYA